jgi:MurNAc alpha-1-phosphate uridylyltransferase
MQCVILAGGAGTRMRPLTETIPKALVPVRGRPFADHQLRLLARQSVRDVVYCIGYRGDLVRRHVGDGSRFGLSVAYVDEGAHLRGTAGALRLALDKGALDDPFTVLYGDSYLPIELEPVWRTFRAGTLPALMVVHRNEGRWDSSNVLLEDGRVALYDKHGTHARADELHWIDYGLSVLDRELIAAEVPPASVVDLEEVYHRLSLAGKLAGYEVDRRFYEVGSPAGLEELERYLEITA